MNALTENTGYEGWLRFSKLTNVILEAEYRTLLKKLVLAEDSEILGTAKEELVRGIQGILDTSLEVSDQPSQTSNIILATQQTELDLVNTLVGDLPSQLNDEGYVIKSDKDTQSLVIFGKTDKGVLYGVFHLLRLLQTEAGILDIEIIENPKNQLRMLNHWDNMDGSIERGYAGKSIFFEDNRFVKDFSRIRDYARLLASIGINGTTINNVNVHEVETNLITEKFLPDVARVADIFRDYGITLFLSINYASTIQLGGLGTADPLDENVRHWWKEKAKEIYSYIPDFGGVVVKADSEHRPGPFTYGRNHADGSNMLAEALEPFGGIVLWRCFVYNCLQDWRDRSIDRARAAYDHFKPLDGQFKENVLLQIKNGPMDFQVREGVSPLFGAMPSTNQILEFQITQEYTGQQRHLCYLIPQWKEILDFDTYAKGEGSPVKSVVDGSMYDYKYSGITAVVNVGNDTNWTGHTLAQANLYGYGRLIWNPDLSTEEITDEWVKATFGAEPQVVETITEMLLKSWSIYEKYTSPLGVGWMVNPNHHYGPNVDGYEYDRWGTYHFADLQGIGVDRTVATGTGYTGQYFPENTSLYESVDTCPDELLLFFHHVPYTHQLKSGVSVIQHIYNTHFEGVEEAEELKNRWLALEGKIDDVRFRHVLARQEEQAEHSKEWRDIINTYFYRKSGIPDELNRTIY